MGTIFFIVLLIIYVIEIAYIIKNDIEQTFKRVSATLFTISLILIFLQLGATLPNLPLYYEGIDEEVFSYDIVFYIGMFGYYCGYFIITIIAIILTYIPIFEFKKEKKQKNLNNNNQKIHSESTKDVITSKSENKAAETKEPKHSKKFLLISALIIISSLAVGSFVLFEDNFTTIANSIIKRDISEVKQSVVKIVIYDKENDELATGSGVCVFENNIIVTNFHVIEGASKIQIVTDSNQTYDINKINAFSKKEDLALISGNFNLQPIILGDTNKIAVGDNIIAVGSPEGQLNTVSTGIISNLNNDYDIGISTPISPGSSGGALLNSKNQLIGITYASYNSDSAQNLNYAINKNYIEKMYHSIEINTCKQINNSNISSFVLYMGYSAAFEYSNSYYTVSNFDVWESLTNDIVKFPAYVLSQESEPTLCNIFSDFSTEDKYLTVELYKNMLEYESKNLKDLSNVSTYDAILDTDIIPKYKFAMMLTDYDSTDNIEYIINKYPMEDGEAIFLKLLYGNLSMYNLSNSQYKSLSQFIFNNCDNSGEIAFFKLFDYEISYDSNGNVNRVYWYY